jgi:hypothetical protein
MLTGDGADEMTIENERETDDTVTYDSFEWEYNHKQIVEDFAHASINIIEQAIAFTEYSKIVKSITFIESGSPSFYNYTTDWYTMSVNVDMNELEKYIDIHTKEIEKIAESYDNTGIVDLENYENMYHAGVCHILNNCITADDYNMAMWEKETEIYYENTTYKKITV